MDNIINTYSKINHLDVSREACLDFEKFIDLVIEKNKNINIISKNTATKEIIRKRHVIDSVQAIDFIELNKDITDLGSGGGFPGIVLAIIAKHQKKKVTVNLFEKSHHKSSFLREVTRKLNLDTEIIQKDIFQMSDINSGTIIARAFKPMPIVLKLVYEKFNKYENLILFMGKNGKKILEDTTNEWKFDYIEKKSLTNEDSFLVNIKNIKRIF